MDGGYCIRSSGSTWELLRGQEKLYYSLETGTRDQPPRGGWESWQIRKLGTKALVLEVAPVTPSPATHAVWTF